MQREATHLKSSQSEVPKERFAEVFLLRRLCRMRCPSCHGQEIAENPILHKEQLQLLRLSEVEVH